MTTEERFTKIENALHTVSENQSRHDVAIRDLIVVSRTLLNAQAETTNQIQRLAQVQQDAAHNADVQLQRSREESERSRKEFDHRLREIDERYAARSAEIEEKLNALIEIVDRIIRKKGDN